MQFEKIHLGKGNKVIDLDIIRASIARETLEVILKNHLLNFESKEFQFFEVAALKETDSTEIPTPPTSAKK